MLATALIIYETLVKANVSSLKLTPGQLNRCGVSLILLNNKKRFHRLIGISDSQLQLSVTKTFASYHELTA